MYYDEDHYHKVRNSLKTIEVRHFDEEYGLDEIVAKNASVHLEQTDDGRYFLSIHTDKEYVLVSVGSKNGRASVRANIYEWGNQAQ